MAKSYITLDTRIDTFKDKFNDLTNLVGNLDDLTTSSSGDSDLVQAINEHSAELGTITAGAMTTTASTVSTAIKEHALELGTITAGAMGTSASTVSTAIAELDAEADSDRSNFANNIRTIMLDPDGTGVSKEVTSTANNSTNETTFLTFVDGATGAQGIETDTGLTYNPSTGNLVMGGELTAATLDISGTVDIDGTTNLDAVDIDGAVQIDAAVSVGVNDTGYDVKFFGDAASAYMQWDASVDDLILGGAARIVVPDGQLVLAATAVTSTAAELNLLDGVSGLVKADFTKLAAVNSTAAELNILDGSATSATSTTIADADRVIVNDNGTMVQVAVTDLAAYFDDEITAMPNLVATGALNSGTITSGFGNINIGSSTITTTGLITAGAITLGNAVLSEAELEILDGANVTTAELNLLAGVSGLVQADFTKLAAVTSTAAEINVLDGTDAGNASNNAITVVDGDALIMNDGGTMRQVDISLLKSYFGQVDGGTALSTIDIDGATDIGAAIVNADLFIVDDGAGGANRKTAASRLLTYTMAGTLSNVTQTNIERVGTLTELTVDQTTINGSTISSTGSNPLNLVPANNQAVIIDGTINIDAGVVTGATSITSTAFVGALTGSVTGNAGGTAAIATAVTVADESSDTTSFPLFATAATGNLPPKTGSNLTFNSSSGLLTATAFAGNITGAVTGNATTASTLATPRAIAITGDVTASGVNFNGGAGISLSTSLAANAVVTATIAADAVTYVKLQDLGTANRVLGSTSTGVIGETQIVTAMIASDAVTAAKIADNVVNSEHIAAGALDNEHYASASITGAKIAADTVAEANMADDAIGSAQMKSLVTFTLKDSGGSAIFTMHGAGA